MSTNSPSRDQPAMLLIASSEEESDAVDTRLASAGIATTHVSTIDTAHTRAEEADYMGVVVGPGSVEGLDHASLQRFVERFPDIPIIMCSNRISPSVRQELDEYATVLHIDEPVDSNGFAEAVLRALRPEVQEKHRHELYERHVEEARDFIESREFDRADAEARHAVALDEERPEAFNLLGVLMHLHGNQSKAVRFLRTAVSLDPTYEPAKHNLESFTTSPSQRSGIDLG